MHIPADEVGHLNLLEYDALMLRKQMDDDRQRLNTAIVAASVWNALGGGANGKPVSALDYVPRLKEAAGIEENANGYDMRDWSAETQQGYFMALFANRMKEDKGTDA